MVFILKTFSYSGKSDYGLLVSKLVCLSSSHLVAEPMNVLVACGPYTPSDSLTFDPLLDLINVIVRDRPDVCLLVELLYLHFCITISSSSSCYVWVCLTLPPLLQLGPFVDSKHEQIEVCLTVPSLCLYCRIPTAPRSDVLYIICDHLYLCL